MKSKKLYSNLILTITAVAAILLFSQCQKGDGDITLQSPNGELYVSIPSSMDGNEDKNQLTYTVFKKNVNSNDTLVNPSPLGIEREDASFTDNLELINKGGVRTIREQYNLPSGKKLNIDYQANQRTLTYQNKDEQKVKIQFRVFNDGIAFRYLFPGESNKKYTVVNERTSFNIPQNGKTWIHPYSEPSQTKPAYEEYYRDGLDIGTDAPEKYGWAFPALFHVKEHWMLISESGLDTTYCGTHLNPEVNGGLYTIRFPEEGERFGTGSKHPVSDLPWEMPWRFIIIGKDLGTVVESNMVTHLSDSSRVADTDWIEPGKASWSWWSYHGERSVERLKEYIDFAKTMNWKYSLVDAGWPDMSDGNIREVIQYAEEKGIGLFLWYNSGGRTNRYNRGHFVMPDDKRREKEMKKLHEWGIKGIKVDFFNSDKQHVIKMYHDILVDAAKYELMVNFHGCTLPRGWRRTYPNLVTMEAIKGAENYRYDESYTERAPGHNTIIPFTRNVVGPMDYTPGTFSNNNYPHKTTYGHELALPVIYESGIKHLADKVEAYNALPAQVRQFLQKLPAAWDETRFVMGKPGEMAVIARKKEETWYIGGINGTSEEKKIKIHADFLEEGSKYTMTSIADGEQPETFTSGEKTLEKDESVYFRMKPKGGFVATFEIHNPS
jgi:hypothetical protein